MNAELRTLPIDELNMKLQEEDDIRVEVVLKKAAAMYERHGPDVCEIFSQPRVCREAASKTYGGDTLTPGRSLDLTINDPTTGLP